METDTEPCAVKRKTANPLPPAKKTKTALLQDVSIADINCRIIGRSIACIQKELIKEGSDVSLTQMYKIENQKKVIEEIKHHIRNCIGHPNIWVPIQVTLFVRAKQSVFHDGVIKTVTQMLNHCLPTVCYFLSASINRKLTIPDENKSDFVIDGLKIITKKEELGPASKGKKNRTTTDIVAAYELNTD